MIDLEVIIIYVKIGKMIEIKIGKRMESINIGMKKEEG